MHIRNTRKTAISYFYHVRYDIFNFKSAYFITIPPLPVSRKVTLISEVRGVLVKDGFKSKAGIS